jgi:CxxC motif-containing protein (DUF1111 family)
VYSDLLLHDILPPGSRGLPEGVATATEFRTAPLWGVARTGPYMHDGAAYTLEDAILAHDGEGSAARDAFSALSAGDRAALVWFLSTL